MQRAWARLELELELGFRSDVGLRGGPVRVLDGHMKGMRSV